MVLPFKDARYFFLFKICSFSRCRITKARYLQPRFTVSEDDTCNIHVTVKSHSIKSLQNFGSEVTREYGVDKFIPKCYLSLNEENILRTERVIAGSESLEYFVLKI